MKRAVRWVAAGASCLLAIALIGAIAVPLWLRGPALVAGGLVAAQSDPARSVDDANKERSVLSVMTLNVAHGRGNGRHQALQKGETIKANLDAIAEVLLREEPDLVALQEADGPSVWSGKFNHVEHLAEAGRLTYFLRAEHVKGLKLSYGTALLSRIPLTDTASVTFAPSPPTLSKGFVMGVFPWPGSPDVEIAAVSVHLDFARRKVRRSQVEEMVAVLSKQQRPLIIMGDFNCEWSGKDRTLRTLAEQLGVRPYEPTAPDMITFAKSNKRLDWILISPELEFVSHDTLDDALSDHRVVVAKLELADGR